MLPERTTTTGLSELVTTMRPFQIIRALMAIATRFMTWWRNCRGRIPNVRVKRDASAMGRKGMGGIDVTL